MGKVVLFVCGGFQPIGYTHRMVATLAGDRRLHPLDILVFQPTSALACLSGRSLRHYLDHTLGLTDPQASPQLILWAFSAGCVGAVALANYWHHYRRQVLALFLVDGWGVPWSGPVPLHRLSHDRLTHHTSNWLGSGRVNFVATPAVPHLTLWHNPHQVWGHPLAAHQPWPQGATPLPPGQTAADFLCGWTQHYLALGEAGQGRPVTELKKPRHSGEEPSLSC